MSAGLTFEQWDTLMAEARAKAKAAKEEGSQSELTNRFDRDALKA